MSERRQGMFKFTAHEGTPQALYELDDWRQLLGRDPGNIDLCMKFCRVLARRGLYEEAIERCETCLVLQKEGGQLSVSRRLRVVAMATRLRRAAEKHQGKR